MSLPLPRKRTILAWHRWLGLASALFLVVLSITGLVLNHTERLGLDTIIIRNSLLLNQYGMASGNQISTFRIHETHTISHLDGQLFYNSESLTTGGLPIGVIEDSMITVIATKEKLIYLTQDGELVESINTAQLPYSELQAVGTTIEGRPVLITDEGRITPDENWLEFDRYQASYTVTPLTLVELDEAIQGQLLEGFQGGGISLYRVLLDLHSGRLFGWGGRTLMDLSAIAIIVLVTSGIGGWLRKSRRKPQTT